MAPLIIIVITCIISIIGFSNYRNNETFDRLKFTVGDILGGNQWDRVVTSAFLHADWLHLLFNMYTLWIFAPIVVNESGVIPFVVIYFSSIIGGSLLSLWVHQRNRFYTAIGASGGVVGILFASIVIHPNMGLYFFFIPIAIPAWIFGVLYLSFSIYSMRTQNSNIGHEAHIGGAILGILMSLYYNPHLLMEHWKYILLTFIPIAYLIYYLIKKQK